MLGFIGGTGDEGRGLALRFALAGEKVMIGSRDEGRAREAAESISDHVMPGAIGSGLNIDVASKAGIAFVTLPYAALISTLTALSDALAGKLIVSAVVPLSFSKGRASAIRVEEGSAALQAQSILKNSTVVAAFHNIDARELLLPDRAIDTDVVVCADHDEARSTVMKLAEEIKSVRAINGGGLENAPYVEDMTALLANINRIYKAHSTIKIVGL